MISSCTKEVGYLSKDISKMFFKRLNLKILKSQKFSQSKYLGLLNIYDICLEHLAWYWELLVVFRYLQYKSFDTNLEEQ